MTIDKMPDLDASVSDEEFERSVIENPEILLSTLVQNPFDLIEKIKSATALMPDSEEKTKRLKVIDELVTFYTTRLEKF